MQPKSLLFLSASGAVAGAAALAPSTRPNLLFMMADQLRWDQNGYSHPNASYATHTPNLDKIAAEGMSVRYSWSSTPTCTPARGALLTGQSPWQHGMLGYGAIAPVYPLAYPKVLAAAGYETVSLGKDHFGWNATSDSGIAHGFQKTVLYDGLGSYHKKDPDHWNGERDDYDRWFDAQTGGLDPQATLDGLDGDGWNGWHGKAYVYNETLHPTAWLGRQAVSYLTSYAKAAPPHPFMLKVSFHRPHSPYDPPARLLDAIDPDTLRPQHECRGAAAALADGVTAASHPELFDGHGDTWCLKFRGNVSAGDPPGCGDTADAWCGKMPAADMLLSRRAYTASVAFVDEQVPLHSLCWCNST